MIMEMRVYRCLPGRLPALMKRFDTLTLKLWDKHGIKQAGFFTTLIGTSNQELTYFVAWELAGRSRKEVDRISVRSRLDRRPRQERGGRPDHRQYRQPVAGADRVLLGKITCRCNPVIRGLNRVDPDGADRHGPRQIRRKIP